MSGAGPGGSSVTSARIRTRSSWHSVVRQRGSTSTTSRSRSGNLWHTPAPSPADVLLVEIYEHWIEGAQP